MNPDNIRHTGQTSMLLQNDTTQRIIVGAMFVIVAILVIFPMRDYDTFWYMANGRVLFETGEIADRELFSYTAFGTRFTNGGWLGQFILYLVFRCGGPDALIFFKVGMTLLMSFLLYRTGRILGTPRIWAALLMVFVVYAQLWRFVERLQLFTYLLLAVLSLILHGWRAGKLPAGTIWLVPLVMGIWDLFHGSIYGLLLLLAVVAGETTCWILKGKADVWPGLEPLSLKRLRTLYGATALAMLLMAVSPYGLLHGNLFYFVNLISGETEAKYIQEYLAPGLKQFAPFWIMFSMVALSIVSAGRRLSPVWLFIAVPFGLLAARHCRSIEAFGPAVYPILAVSVARLTARLDNWRPILHKMIVAIAVIGLTTYLLHFKFVKQQYRYMADEKIDDFSFRLGINEVFFPVGSSRFIIENNVQGRMFNSDQFGGYLAYFLAPQRPIFQYNHPTIFKHLYGYLHNPAERQRYGITYAIVGHTEEVQMFQRDGFVMVYWEPAAMVLLRPTLENRELIQRFSIRHFNPLDSADKFRKTAADPQKFLQLMKETGDYLAYREDPRIARIFAELIHSEASRLSEAQRRESLERVWRYNSAYVSYLHNK